MIILASTSPRRKNLLKKAKVSFRVMVPTYHEKHRIRMPPSKLVMMHAKKKAQSCLKRVEESLILSADTLVYCKGQIIGKPKNRKHARQILGKLQGRWHVVYTGVALFKVKKHRITKRTVFYVKTKVRIKKLTPRAIKSYFKRVNPLDKAGAYAIQSPHGGIIEKVQGSFSNAVGLPVERVTKKLRAF